MLRLRASYGLDSPKAHTLKAGFLEADWIVVMLCLSADTGTRQGLSPALASPCTLYLLDAMMRTAVPHYAPLPCCFSPVVSQPCVDQEPSNCEGK